MSFMKQIQIELIGRVGIEKFPKIECNFLKLSLNQQESILGFHPVESVETLQITNFLHSEIIKISLFSFFCIISFVIC